MYPGLADSRRMQQDLFLNPLLDGLLVRSPLQVLVQVTKHVNRLAGIPWLSRVLVKEDLPTDLMHPDVRAAVNRILMPGVVMNFLKDLVLNVPYEIN